jgi:hypothetical protein
MKGVYSLFPHAKENPDLIAKAGARLTAKMAEILV